jgi:PAS domain S-box-containing protein
MARSLLLTNHLQVLSALAEAPDMRIRELAASVGLTERATHRIVGELVDAGYLSRDRRGVRNHYEVHAPGAHAQPDAALARAGRLLAPSSDAANDTDADDTDTDTDTDSFYRAVFEASEAGVTVSDVNGRLLAVNASFCAIAERTREELVGHHALELTHPDDVAADVRAFAELHEGARTAWVREKRLLLPDGRFRWVEVRITSTRHPRTGETILTASIVDISARRRQAAELAEAESRFRGAFDNAPFGMALVSPEGRWLKVNAALCEMTGYRETSLLLRSFQDITHPDDLDDDLALAADVLAGRRRSYQLEKRYLHAHGGLVWVRLSVALVRDEAGAPLYFISQIEDVTERRVARAA